MIITIRKWCLFSFLLLVMFAFASEGHSFIVLGENFNVLQGKTFNQTTGHDGYLVGTLKVDGTYNLMNDRLRVNALNISGTFSKSRDASMGGHTWFGGRAYGFMPRYVITGTGYFKLVNQADGEVATNSIANDGIIELEGGSLKQIGWFDGSARGAFTNNGTIRVVNGYLGADLFVNNGTVKITGTYHFDKQMNFKAISKIDVSNRIVTDIFGVPGLIMTYDPSRSENAYLDKKSYLLSGGGLLTNYYDVVYISGDQPRSCLVKKKQAKSLSFEYRWDTGAGKPSYDKGYPFDVFVYQGEKWHGIQKFDIRELSTGWMMAKFPLPGKHPAPTQFVFVMKDHLKNTDHVVYLRNINEHVNAL